MTKQPKYRQAAFNLTPGDTHAPDAATLAGQVDPAPFIVPIDRDPAVLPNRRLPGDFWSEFHLEWAFREARGMAPVSPREFAAIRDWSDGVAWSVPDDEIGGAYGPSAGYDDVLPDAPRGERTVFDARRAKLDAAIDVLANKVEQIVTGDGYRAYLKMLAKFHSYSANNVAFIWTSVPRQ